MFYLTSLNDEAMSKSQNGVSPGNSPRSYDGKLILAQVSISNNMACTIKMMYQAENFVTRFLNPLHFRACVRTVRKDKEVSTSLWHRGWDQSFYLELGLLCGWFEDVVDQ